MWKQRAGWGGWKFGGVPSGVSGRGLGMGPEEEEDDGVG